MAAIAFYHIIHIQQLIHLPKHPLARVALWNDVAQATKQLHKKYPHALILSDERKATAVTMYNIRSVSGDPYPVIKWNPDNIPHDYYDMTTDIIPHKGKDFIILTRVSDETTFAPYFNKVIHLNDMTIQHKKFSAYLLKNFNGYTP